MADANPKVMEMIEAELKKSPDISNAELFEKARKVDSGVGNLSPRQFNATYPLQVKRALKPRKRKARKGGKARPARAKADKAGGGRARGQAGGDGRDRVRSVLLELAKDIASAEGKGDIVDVVAGIDRYVDRVMKASS